MEKVKIKEADLVRFTINKRNEIKVYVNEAVYTDKKIFKETISMVKSWFEYQIPHLEETFENYHKNKSNDKTIR